MKPAEELDCSQDEKEEGERSRWRAGSFRPFLRQGHRLNTSWRRRPATYLHFESFVFKCCRQNTKAT